jgi:DNA-binding transcriptional LysR family regulator
MRMYCFDNLDYRAYYAEKRHHLTDGSMDINLNLLRTFLRVAEHSSFRDASHEVYRSQSAVSAQIKQLEQQVGTLLFHRTTRQVRLTTAGELLLRAAQRGVGEVELGLREIRETADLQSGRVSLSCAPTIAGTRLPPILAAFERHYPTVHVFVRELHPAELFESVRRAEADFGIGPVIQSADLDIETILDEEVYALVPRRYSATEAKTITLQQLARMPVLLLNHATALRSILDEAARRSGITLTPKYECTQVQTLVTMAVTGLGAVILPKSVIPRRVERTVQVLRIVSPTLTRQIGLITVRGRTLSPAASRLAELIRELIQAEVGKSTGARARRPRVKK